MLPIKDNVPTRTFPVVTVALIAANIAIWLWEVRGGVNDEVLRYGYDPCTVEGSCVQPASLVPHLPWYEGVFSSMFLHGGWLHLIGNMWFLWVFGNNVEDSMGRARYLAFYLLCGLAAAATQTFVSPGSIVPMVGASGAISGVMGAYVILYPRVRVHMLVFLFIFITRIVVPAYLMLGYWFLLQLLGGSAAQGEGGVAFWAHVGGFVAGAALISVFKDPELVGRHRALARYV